VAGFVRNTHLKEKGLHVAAQFLALIEGENLSIGTEEMEWPEILFGDVPQVVNLLYLGNVEFHVAHVAKIGNNPPA
jgi:hypothetical protein